MIILAIDTCCGPFSITIKDDAKILAQLIEQEENKQAELLVVGIEQALRMASLNYDDIDLIAITKGPGSFTGIRSGLAAAYAIATIKNIPCVGITTLEVLANQLINQIHDTHFYITVAAGRGRYYAQLFDQYLKPQSEIALMEQDEIEFLEQKVYGDYVKKQLIDTVILANLGLRQSYNVTKELPQAVYFC